ncbi:MAG: hypothetical protein GY928_23960 [Colwellia sp.]|nr:hypothetical protein [Colwellia sp.]
MESVLIISEPTKCTEDGAAQIFGAVIIFQLLWVRCQSLKIHIGIIIQISRIK